jgi:pimeloyl-[acyl-carrier protein] methyl ester esterase
MDSAPGYNFPLSPLPKLVLLPGMDGTGRLFTDFVDALPEEFETVTVRYPTDRCLSYSELVGLVRSSCPESEPFILVAESFSTPLAIKYAAMNPSNLEGLILCAGFAVSPMQGWRRFLGSLFAPILFCVGLPEFAVKLWLVGPDAPPSLVAAVRVAVLSVWPKVLAARLRAVLACESRAELGQIAKPILYIQAKRDHLVSASCLEVIRRIKPQVAVAEILGPHLVLQREPQRSAEVIVAFVRSGRLAGTV